jgi:hypothetical protein
MLYRGCTRDAIAAVVVSLVFSYLLGYHPGVIGPVVDLGWHILVHLISACLASTA